MQPILPIKVDLNFSGYFDLIETFQNSGRTLYAAALDGILENKNSSAGCLPDEFHNAKLIPCIYLLRHSIELGLKAIVERFFLSALTKKCLREHDIAALCEAIPNWTMILASNDIIKKGLGILEKYEILTSDQLFRYHINNNGVKLESLGFLRNEDIEGLLGFSNTIRVLYLEYCGKKNTGEKLTVLTKTERVN